MGPRTDGPPPLKKMIIPALFVGGLFYVTFTRQPEQAQVIIVTGEALGTTWALKSAETPSDARAAELKSTVETALAEVDASMSTYRDDSELMALNRADGLDPVVLSEGLGAVLAEAMDIGVVTHGAFDVTVGPLVDAWGFGPDKRMVAPSAEALAEILPIIGSDKIEISEAGLTKAHPDLSIDLSAIAKGYAVDLIVDRLQGIGANNVLMEVGGEIVARGKSPSGHVWRLGIETPSATGREVFEVVGLSDEAMATSGDYRNFYEVDGARVSHLIDPRTAQPIAHRLASVTVITERCSTADAWATALSVLGEDEGLKLAEAQGLKAYFIVRDADGTFSTRSTSPFQSLK